MSLAANLLTGDRRALARLITLIENRAEGADEALADLYPHTGAAHIIGVTGAPGTGKSSLVNQIALEFRKQDATVGILAVDPTSPFSGGAILGDRIRMRDLSGDQGVFIRSMATRGSLGGLARAAADVTRAIDAAGFDVVLIETVGAGQSEVEIAHHAHSVVVVEAPGMGDDVQAIKAGILEIADILVVNKSDDPRAQNTLRALRAMLDLAMPAGPQTLTHHGQIMEMLPASQTPSATDGKFWDVPIQPTNALTGEGVPDLLVTLSRHREHLQTSGELERRLWAQTAAEVDERLREALLTRLLEKVDRDRMAKLMDRVRAREVGPQAAVDMLIENHA